MEPAIRGRCWTSQQWCPMREPRYGYDGPLAGAFALLLLLLLAVAGCGPSGEAPLPPPGAARAEPPAQAAPVVTMVLTGPAEGAVGGVVAYQIELTNHGKATAEDLLLRCLASENLWHASGTSTVERDLPGLAPGETKAVGVEFLVIGPGQAEIRAELCDSSGTLVAGVGQAWTATAEPAAGRTEPGEPPGATTSQTEPPPTPWEPEPPKEPPVDLGPPLVEDAAKLRRLDPVRSVWLDPEGKRVVMLGQVCQREAPLEMFACPKGTKEHEAIVAVDTKASTVHAGLLAVGAKAGHPVVFDPKYVPASGARIEVTVHWRDAQGKVLSAKAQDWVRHVKTKEAMTEPWVFAGSGFWKDERTGEEHYLAESGDFICVSNFPSAMLDLPVESSDKAESLLFEAFTERIPPLGTPVTVVLTPVGQTVAKPQAADD